MQEIKACSERAALHQIHLARQEMQRQFEIRKADMADSFQREVDERVEAQVEIELARFMSRGERTCSQTRVTRRLDVQ